MKLNSKICGVIVLVLIGVMTTATSQAGACSSRDDDRFATCVFRAMDRANNVAKAVEQCAARYPGSGRWIDLGLTVLDTRWGWEWTKTDDSGGLTDKDELYTWTENEADWTQPNGTLFTLFLAGLNGMGPAAIPGCYAGNCNWRIQASFRTYGSDNPILDYDDRREPAFRVDA